MRQIFKASNGDMESAWIGESAPVPEGWHLDVNTAMERQGQREEVTPQTLEEQIIEEEAEIVEQPVKRRGRPRKNK